MLNRILSASRRGLSTVALVLFGVLLGTAVGEGALRVAGFSYQALPTVQFGWPNPTEMVDLYVPDRDLLWVPREYAARLAKAQRHRPDIVFLGDSCTQFGTYTGRTLARLRKTDPNHSTGFNAGVGGWSSVQGLAQLRRDILPLRPQVITLYFGWNDHWVALGAPDNKARPGAISWWLSQHSRVYQLLIKLRLATSIKVDPNRPNRVDLETYKANLREMVGLSRRAGARVVLITAPSNHRPGHEPAALAERHLRRLDELVPLHRSYVEATRGVARETGVTLCEAARAFARDEKERDHYFKKDGIHLTKAGDTLLASLLSTSILEALGTR